MIRSCRKLQSWRSLNKNSWKLQPVPSFQFVLFHAMLFCFMVLQNNGTVRTTMLTIERFYLFIILSLQIYLLYVCSFTMWHGGAQVIKEVRGCGGAK